jgi:hypothetical protein
MLSASLSHVVIVYSCPRIVHRSKEGGVFVHFKSRLYEAKEVDSIIRAHLTQQRPSSFLMREPIRGHLVTGRPFLHDMVRIYTPCATFFRPWE